MRTLIKVRMVDVEKANHAAADGSLQRFVQETLERLQPEAAYFTPEGGTRAAYIVFDLADASDIPVIAERFFQQLNASVELQPVMNREELQAGLARIGQGIGATA
jgi:hypothetical protein